MSTRISKEELNQAVRDCIDSGQCETLNSIQAQLKELGSLKGELEALMQKVIEQLANMRHESLQSDREIASALHGIIQEAGQGSQERPGSRPEKQAEQGEGFITFPDRYGFDSKEQ